MKKRFEGIEGLFVFVLAVGFILGLVAIACPVLMIIGGAIIMNGNPEVGMGMAMESSILTGIEFIIGIFIILMLIKDNGNIGSFIISCIVAMAIFATVITLFVISYANGYSYAIPLIVTGSITLPIAVTATVMWILNY